METYEHHKTCKRQCLRLVLQRQWHISLLTLSNFIYYSNILLHAHTIGDEQGIVILIGIL